MGALEISKLHDGYTGVLGTLNRRILHIECVPNVIFNILLNDSLAHLIGTQTFPKLVSAKGGELRCLVAFFGLNALQDTKLRIAGTGPLAQKTNQGRHIASL